MTHPSADKSFDLTIDVKAQLFVQLTICCSWCE